MRITRNASLANMTTMRVGGPAHLVFTVYSVNELARAIRFAKHHGIPWIVLGGGSNIVFPDEGYEGIVVRLSMCGVIYEEEGDNVYVTAEAGKNWDAFVRETVEDDLYGLENLSGIPGNVGAAPIQNIGAYGKEVSEHITAVKIFDACSEEVHILSPKDCAFEYRDSAFKRMSEKCYIVLSVTFRLSRKGTCNTSYRDLAQYFADAREPSLEDVRRAVLAIRARKLPDMDEWGTCGSFFTNPIVSMEKARELSAQYPGLSYVTQEDGTAKLSAGWLIEHVGGWKGVVENGVGMYTHHALTLVNKGGNATHIRTFSQRIKNDIHTKTGVQLHEEPHIVLS